jgi:DNA-directed RNA polymerase specialized sigma54-like protein
MRGLSQRLELRQSQTLIMTPQLQQAIKMLQFSYLELTDFVDAEIQQNPLLELQERPLGKDTPVDDAGNAERMTPKAVPEMLTESSQPTRRMVGNRNGERIAIAQSISAASRSRGTGAMGASMARVVPGSIRPQPGRAPCASICSSRSGPILAIRAIG